MLLQNETNFSVVRFKDGELSRADDTIVTEFPITLYTHDWRIQE
ncbi:hypothetical protein V7152_12255 [Neobacillus drentensis]